MRTVLVAAILGIVPFSSAATPMIELIWTDHSGGGPTGTPVTDADVGDVLRLLVRVESGSDGLTGAFLTLSWDPAVLLGLDATTCPTPENPISSLCTPDGVADFSLIATVFVDISELDNDVGYVSQFAATVQSSGGPIDPFPEGTSMYIGAIEFQVVGSGATSVDVDYDLFPGLDSVNTLEFPFAYFPEASATIVPEPASGTLLGAGLLGLALRSRRHRG